MEIISLEDIDTGRFKGIPKEILPYIQMFDSGFRVVKNNLDWTDWNGCVFVDIDSKKYAGPKKIDWDEVERKMIEDFTCLYHNNFYCVQRSHSGNSFHILFYFNVEKTQTNFKYLSRWSNDEVAKWFITNDMPDVVKTDGVMDKCNSTTVQGLLISSYPIHVSRSQNDPDFGLYDISAIEIPEEEYTPQQVEFKKSNVKRRPGKTNFCRTNDFSYQFRWRITNVLGQYFGKENKQKSIDLYKTVVGDICDRYNQNGGKKYTESELMGQFIRDYDRTIEGHYPLSRIALDFCEKNFGIKFKIKKEFIPKEYSFSIPDDTIAIDKYLSEIDWSFSDGFYHLDSPCGSGKTFMTDIICKTGKRVCFISPMTSILSDSFDEKNGWIIIDDAHREIAEHICPDVDSMLKGLPPIDVLGEKYYQKQWSVATTWESFVCRQMWDCHFDIIFVDEIHTLYMYDYRVHSITDLKESLLKCKCPVVMMTGSPSYELNEFPDIHKIKVNMVIPKVPTELLFYNRDYKGWVYNDISEWVKDPFHLAVVYYDKTNYKVEDEMKLYGLECDIFNKSYEDTTTEILSTHTLRKQITFFSVYGQAGINLYIPKDKRVRVYILDNNALGIIQYSNRIRNKETIDKVIIPFMTSRISNAITPMVNEIDYDLPEEQVKNINDIYSRDVNAIEDLISKQTFQYRFGLPDDVLDMVGGRFILNRERYRTWKLIQNTHRFEEQIQIIYNRLVQNGYDVTFNYLDEDTKDTQKRVKDKDRFSGQMIGFDWGQVNKNRDNTLWIDPEGDFKKIITGDLIKRMEHIINTFYDRTGKDMEKTQQMFRTFVGGCIRDHKSITKSDITRYSKCLTLLEDFDIYSDKVVLFTLLDGKYTIPQTVTSYVNMVYNKSGVDWKKLVDETYEKISSLKNAISRYRSLFEGKTGEIEKVEYKDDKRKEIYQYVMSRFKTRGPKQRKVIIDGVEYLSSDDAQRQLGVSKSWVSKHRTKG